MSSSNPQRPSDGSPYYSNVNKDLLGIIPAGLGAIYEFGCGEGVLGRAYKSWNPGCTYFGVERHAPSCARAEEVLDAAVLGDVEDSGVTDRLLSEFGTASALVYGDVLEHLVDPWRTFEDHLRLLAPDGVVCACIPNSQHWSLSLALVLGNMTYTESGLHDSTHLRFFTRKSLSTFFSGFGLTRSKLIRRKFGKVPNEVSLTADSLAAQFNVQRELLYDDLTTFQYVVQSVHGNAPPRLHIDWKKHDQPGGYNHIRVDAPATLLSSLPGVTVQTHGKFAKLSGRPPSPSVFLWQRPILQINEDLRSIAALRERRQLIVVDFDDDPDVWPQIAENHHLTFVGAHAVQVSTPILKDKITPLNPNTFLVPNRISRIEPFEDVLRETKDGVIFVGGFNRGDDFESVAETVNQFIETDPDHWSFLVVGDQRIADALNTKRKRFLGILDYPDYARALKRADVALMPLGDKPMNRFKSDLKFLEAAAAGTVVVASGAPYEESVVHSETGFLFDSPTTLAEALSQLKDRQRLLDIRRNAYDFVRHNRMLAPSIGGVVDNYLDLCDRFDELDAGLEARLARLPQSLPTARRT